VADLELLLVVGVVRGILTFENHRPLRIVLYELLGIGSVHYNTQRAVVRPGTTVASGCVAGSEVLGDRLDYYSIAGFHLLLSSQW
jgi:hypothetical protein